MVAFVGVVSSVLAGLASLQAVRAQGTSNVQCLPTFNWANNSLHQNPCVVGAYLQAECNGGTFSVNSIPAGYHYIGPTNDTSTQNPCICSTPVYELVSACGACQNLTFISWSSWSFYCPQSMISAQGVFPEAIPGGTRVPHWAYSLPSDNDDFFDPNAAQLLGDSPESSQVVSSTSSTSSTTSTASITATTTSSGGGILTLTVTTTSSTSTSSSGGGGGTNTGAIAGGVVGGVLGLALLALLGFFLLRRRKAHNDVRAAYAGTPATGVPMAQAGGYDPVAPGSPVGGAAQTPYTGTHHTGSSQPGYQPTVASGGQYYNPSDPSTFPASFPPSNNGSFPQPGGYGAPPGGAPGGYYNEPANTAGRYSGMPEV